MTENKDSAKVVLKPKEGLLATFVHLLEPDDYGSGDKYTVTVIIPKEDKKTVKAIKTAIKSAMDKGAESTFKGRNLKKAKNPLKDGDDEDTEKYPYYADSYFVQFKTNQKPNVINKSKKQLTTDEEVYSGMLIWVSGVAIPYFNDGWGVTMILGNVVKIADGERMGGFGFDVDDDFGDELDGDEFDDDDYEDDDYEADGDDSDELDYEEAEELIDDAKEIEGGKKEVRKLLKKAGARKVTDITKEGDLDKFVESLEEWIEENE